MRIKHPSLAPEDGNKGGQGGGTGDAAAKAAADKATADAAAKTTADATAAAAAEKATADAAAKVKAEADKVGTDAATKAAADAALKAGEKKAPDTYKLALPEKTTLGDDDLKAIETIARENDLSNEDAQALVQRNHDLLVEQSAKFLEVTTADKTYGGDNLAKSQARAKAVIDKVRPANHPRRAAFTALLDRSGYGNNIEILSFLADLGALTEEDGAITGEGATRGSKSAEDVLYGGEKK